MTTTTRYKSDNIYKEAVLKFYALAWGGSLGIVVVVAVMLLAVYEEDCRQGFKYALAILPAVHVVAWLILANMMCATFQAMSNAADPTPQPGAKIPPAPEDTDREIPMTKGEKTGNISWD